MTSPDGINWKSRTSAADNHWRSIAYGNGLFVAVSSDGVMTSPDGINWTSQTSAANNAWSSVTYGDGLFVAVSSDGKGNGVMTSSQAVVPNVVRQTCELAETTLMAALFTVVVNPSNVFCGDQNFVSSQTPVPGDHANTGDSITLTIVSSLNTPEAGGSFSRSSSSSSSSTSSSSSSSSTSSSSTDAPSASATSKTDCTVAPTVSFSPTNPTADDKVTFRVTHPCLGMYENQWVFFGRAEIDEENNVHMVRNINIGVEGDSWTGSAKLDPGVHKFLFKIHFVVENKTVISDLRQVDVTVSDGAAPTKNSCNNDSVTLVDARLIVTCPLIWSNYVTPIFGEIENIDTKSDDTKMVADLSNLSSGWHQLELSVNYGIEFFTTRVTVCLTSCDVPKSFAPFTVLLDKDNATVTGKNECNNNFWAVSQMYKSTDHLYLENNLDYLFLAESNTVTLKSSTGALFIAQDPCDEKFSTVFAELERPVTPPTPDDVKQPIDDKVKTVVLPEITGGVTDLPVGEVTGGTISVSPVAESFAVTPEVVSGLLDLTIAGSSVEKVEISTDGVTWVNPVFGYLPLASSAKTMLVRLTAANGKQSVITQQIDRTVPVVVSQTDETVTSGSSSSGSGILSYWWVLLILLILAAAAVAARNKRPA